MWIYIERKINVYINFKTSVNLSVLKISFHKSFTPHHLQWIPKNIRAPLPSTCTISVFLLPIPARALFFFSLWYFSIFFLHHFQFTHSIEKPASPHAHHNYHVTLHHPNAPIQPSPIIIQHPFTTTLSTPLPSSPPHPLQNRS